MRIKFIQAGMKLDWIEPYRSMGQFIPVITTSDHPRFRAGQRFDWGYVKTAINDGYTVVIYPQNGK